MYDVLDRIRIGFILEECVNISSRGHTANFKHNPSDKVNFHYAEVIIRKKVYKFADADLEVILKQLRYLSKHLKF